MERASGESEWRERVERANGNGEWKVRGAAGHGSSSRRDGNGQGEWGAAAARRKPTSDSRSYPRATRRFRAEAHRTRAEARTDMALWQVEFAIVPRRALATKTRVALADVMDTEWWSADRLPSG